ncbi:serine hydrolase domain-containing protein [Brevibacillus sp. SYSU BS000544]|uniref:serine hydrolase domain-containing protein n=1 Tax=Brevibacillus sp. SYSU BS000544 TaxID=3416443 RepID=UPI003CE492C9
MKNALMEILTQERMQRWASPPTHHLTIGLVSKAERLVWTKGQWDEDSAAKSLYEIGSITKTIIGLLLAIGEQKGIWSRSNSLSDLFPEWSSSSFAQQTTLLQLVTHTAGLPEVPANFRDTIVDKLDPYANYSEGHLIEAVLRESPKTKKSHQYSNYGFGILGWLLSKRLGKNLEDALNDEVFKPLGMTDSRIGLIAQMNESNGFATPLPVFNAKGKSVPHWHFLDTMAGAGGVCSTITDMLNYIEAHLNLTDEPILRSALAQCHQEHHAIFPDKGIGIGYGWMFYKEKDGSTTHWHNGGTYGSSSFATFNRDKQTGLVILSNNGTDLWSQLPLIGMHKMNVDKLAQMLTTRLYQS